MKKSIIVVLIVFIAVFVYAKIPMIINFQGKLTDSAGQDKDGQFDFVFQIFDSVSGSGSIWGTETHNNVQVSDGLYSVLLGQTVTFDGIDFNKDLWLQVTVEGNTMSPRYRLSSVPYAVIAVTATYALTSGAAAGGATQELNNLQDVAVSTAITPASNNAHDIGSDSRRWRSLYAGDVIVSGEVDGVDVAQLKIDTTTIATTHTNHISADDHTQYLELDGSDQMTGDLDMNTNKITGLGTPTANTDAATKRTVELATSSIVGAGGDNFGNHVATQSVNGGGFDIYNVAYASFTNTYATGYSSATAFYGDGSGIDGIDHGQISGLGDDDHTQYLELDGSDDMTGDLSFAGNELQNSTITVTGTTNNVFVSTHIIINGNMTVNNDLSVAGEVVSNLDFNWTTDIVDVDDVNVNKVNFAGNTAVQLTNGNYGVSSSTNVAVNGYLMLLKDIDPNDGEKPDALGMLAVDIDDKYALYISTALTVGGWQKVSGQ